MLKSDFQEQSLVQQLVSEGDTRNEINLILAKSAISKRQYSDAILLLETYMNRIPDPEKQFVYPFYLYLLCVEKRYDEAVQLSRQILQHGAVDASSQIFLDWLEQTFPVSISKDQRRLSWKMH